ncbi:hypothetical protein [Thalassospira sp. MCCC 1A01428]|uniref:hypothetical protein n=1 Tax=Thalassospira sp. MCCC 1A01428 TaxID=1470575 RepID=UPI00111C53EE|nr:hypothetical protein [Thalassospira sp. MCCC 1A01428]
MAIEPGPARNGIDMGKIDTSSWSSSSWGAVCAGLDAGVCPGGTVVLVLATVPVCGLVAACGGLASDGILLPATISSSSCSSS